MRRVKLKSLLGGTLYFTSELHLMGCNFNVWVTFPKAYCVNVCKIRKLLFGIELMAHIEGGQDHCDKLHEY